MYVYFWPISYLIISGKETTYRTVRNTIIEVGRYSISIDQARLLDKHLHNWGRDWVEWGETERENGQHLLICSYKITEYRQQQQQQTATLRYVELTLLFARL